LWTASTEASERPIHTQEDKSPVINIYLFGMSDSAPENRGQSVWKFVYQSRYLILQGCTKVVLFLAVLSQRKKNSENRFTHTRFLKRSVGMVRLAKNINWEMCNSVNRACEKFVRREISEILLNL
jgi:hypothetical protein